MEPEVGRLREFVDFAVSKAIASSLKDSKLVEIEIAERIWDRLWKWAKTFGIIMGLLLTTFAGILGVFGYSNYKQVITAINEAQTSFQNQSKVLTDRLTTLNKSIAEREGTVAEFDKRIPALEKRLADYDLKLPDLANAITLIAKLPEIESKLNQSPEAKAKLETVQTIGFGEERELSPDSQKKIQAFLVPFRTFLAKIGFRAGVDHTPITELSDPKSKHVSLYLNGRIYLGTEALGDQRAVLTAQTEAALFASQPGLKGRTALFYGLQTHFSSSFMDRAYYENLPSHAAKFSEKSSLSPGENTNDKLTVSDVWEGVFWDLRKSIGRDSIDPLLCASWTKLKKVNEHDVLESAKSFLKTLLETDVAFNRGINSDKIRTVFENRGVELK